MTEFKVSLTLLLALLSVVSSATTTGNWDACGGRLERALDALHRDSTRRNRLEEEEAEVGMYQQELRSAPLEMLVSRVVVKLPNGARNTGSPWARVERCSFLPDNNSLQTRVMINDISVSGTVSVMPRDRQPPVSAESCRMTLRLRRAGIDFMTSPIARGRGQMRIRTESSFLEPRFASIYAYGCHPTRVDKQIKRQDKWPPLYPHRDEFPPVPSTPSDNYEAAEPRELVGVSKEVDVVIPNESRRPRFLNAPVAKLGIWRKNVWVTKSPIRERRSSRDDKDSSSGTGLSGNRRSPGSFNSDMATSGDSAGSSSTAETITPLDFVTALNKKKSDKLDKPDKLNKPDKSDISHKSDKLDSIVNQTAFESSTENLLSSFNDSEIKSNVKREGSFDAIDGVPRETRELYPDENLDDIFPVDFENDCRSWQSKENVAREMEDVFLRGASQALTRYIERQLHPAIKETLMISMGYTISYG